MNQLQGVVAHELGHVAGGDSIRMQERRQAGDRDQHPVAGARRAGDRRRRRRRRHGHHDGRPAGRDRRVPGLHPRPGSDRRRDRRHASSRRPGSAARACSTSSASCRTRNIGSRSIPRTATTATHPLSSERIQALEQKLQERSRLEQADRSRARGALPAGQGQAARLRRSQAGGDQISGERPEHPGPLCARLRLSPRRLSGQSRSPKPTRCSRPTRTIPSSSS